MAPSRRSPAADKKRWVAFSTTITDMGVRRLKWGFDL